MLFVDIQIFWFNAASTSWPSGCETLENELPCQGLSLAALSISEKKFGFLQRHGIGSSTKTILMTTNKDDKDIQGGEKEDLV